MIWNIFTDGNNEYDFLHFAAEYLGRWEESIEVLSKNKMKRNLSEFSTFTKSDYDNDPELYEDFPIEYDSLPETKQLFDPKSGIKRFTKLKNIILENESIFEDDFQMILEDIDQVIALLKKASKEGRKWYLDIEV